MLDRRQILKAAALSAVLPLPLLFPGRKSHTDFLRVKVGDPASPYVFAYCNGKKVERSQYADVDRGVVGYVDLWDDDYMAERVKEPPVKRVYGDVQILFVDDEKREEYRMLAS